MYKTNPDRKNGYRFPAAASLTSVVALLAVALPTVLLFSVGCRRHQDIAMKAGMMPNGLSSLPTRRKVHAELYQKALDALEQKINTEYYVCKICGNIHEGNAPDKCSICGAPKSKFKNVI